MIDFTALIVQTPFYAGLLWLIHSQTNRFLSYQASAERRQIEERETLYRVVRESAAVQAKALTALTEQCARAQTAQCKPTGRRRNATDEPAH